MENRTLKSLENQVVYERRNASGYLRPKDTRSSVEKFVDRACWFVLAFAVLYFGGHVVLAVLRGTL